MIPPVNNSIKAFTQLRGQPAQTKLVVASTGGIREFVRNPNPPYAKVNDLPPNQLKSIGANVKQGGIMLPCREVNDFPRAGYTAQRPSRIMGKPLGQFDSIVFQRKERDVYPSGIDYKQKPFAVPTFSDIR
jgi:hypothetical protein